MKTSDILLLILAIALIAGMLLTTECVLAEHKEENPAPPAMPPMGGGMPGMM